MQQITRRTVLTGLGLTGATVLGACSNDEESTLSGQEDETTYHEGVEDSGEGSTGTSTEDSSATTGTLQQVELPSPEKLRNAWAAYAAVWTAAGASGEHQGPRAEGGDWLFVMETAEWAHLTRFQDGRAVLSGQSNPDLERSDAEEKKAREALLAGAPSWWKGYEKQVRKGLSVGFVLGWDGSRWQRSSEAPSDGGFDAFTFVIAEPDDLGALLAMWATEDEKEYTGATKAAIDRVVKSGPEVTSAQLKALGNGVNGSRVSRAVTVARAFAGKGKH